MQNNAASKECDGGDDRIDYVEKSTFEHLRNLLYLAQPVEDDFDSLALPQIPVVSPPAATSNEATRKECDSDNDDDETSTIEHLQNLLALAQPTEYDSDTSAPQSSFSCIQNIPVVSPPATTKKVAISNANVEEYHYFVNYPENNEGKWEDGDSSVTAVVVPNTVTVPPLLPFLNLEEKEQHPLTNGAGISGEVVDGKPRRKPAILRNLTPKKRPRHRRTCPWRTACEIYSREEWADVLDSIYPLGTNYHHGKAIAEEDDSEEEDKGDVFFQELARIIREQWRELPPDLRSRYESLAQEEKSDWFQREMVGAWQRHKKVPGRERESVEPDWSTVEKNDSNTATVVNSENEPGAREIVATSCLQ